MSELIRKFVIPEECQDISYSTDFPENGILTLDDEEEQIYGYKTLEFSVLNDGIKEKHLLYIDGVESGIHELVLKYKDFSELKIEKIFRDVSGPLYVKNSSSSVYALYYDIELEDMIIKQNLLSVSDDMRSCELINEIKECLEAAMAGRQTITDRERQEDRMREDEKERELSQLQDKLQSLFGVRTLSDLHDKLSSYQRPECRLFFDAHGQHMIIEFYDGDYYFITPADTSIETIRVIALKEAAIAEGDALEREDFEFDSDAYALKWFLKDLENKTFDYGTLSNAYLEPVEHAVYKQHTSALGLAIYEDVFGTAATVDKILSENSGPDTELAFYRLTFDMNNNVYHGHVEVYIDKYPQSKAAANKFIRFINEYCPPKTNNAPSSAPSSSYSSEIIQQIKDLKELLDCGAITEDEFNEIKKNLLGQ